jgi:hypothetical protein
MKLGIMQPYFLPYVSNLSILDVMMFNGKETIKFFWRNLS